MTEILKQPQYSPIPIEEQVVILYAGTKGYLDKLPVGKVGEFEHRLVNELKVQQPTVLTAIRETREMKGDVEKTLVTFLDGLVKSFA